MEVVGSVLEGGLILGGASCGRKLEVEVETGVDDSEVVEQIVRRSNDSCYEAWGNIDSLSLTRLEMIIL